MKAKVQYRHSPHDLTCISERQLMRLPLTAETAEISDNLRDCKIIIIFARNKTINNYVIYCR